VQAGRATALPATPCPRAAGPRGSRRRPQAGPAGTRSALDAWGCRPVPAPAADPDSATITPASNQLAQACCNHRQNPPTVFRTARTTSRGVPGVENVGGAFLVVTCSPLHHAELGPDQYRHRMRHRQWDNSSYRCRAPPLTRPRRPGRAATRPQHCLSSTSRGLRSARSRRRARRCADRAFHLFKLPRGDRGFGERCIGSVTSA